MSRFDERPLLQAFPISSERLTRVFLHGISALLAFTQNIAAAGNVSGIDNLNAIRHAPERSTV